MSTVKVSKSLKQFLESSILPKNEWKTWKNYPKSSQDNFFSCFVRFWKNWEFQFLFWDLRTFRSLSKNYPQVLFISLNHGLRTPNEAFFHRNPKLLGLGRQFGQINFGAFGVFSADLSAPILVLWVLCPCFTIDLTSFFNWNFWKKEC